MQFWPWHLHLRRFICNKGERSQVAIADVHVVNWSPFQSDTPSLKTAFHLTSPCRTRKSPQKGRASPSCLPKSPDNHQTPNLLHYIQCNRPETQPAVVFSKLVTKYTGTKHRAFGKISASFSVVFNRYRRKCFWELIDGLRRPQR